MTIEKISRKFKLTSIKTPVTSNQMKYTARMTSDDTLALTFDRQLSTTGFYRSWTHANSMPFTQASGIEKSILDAIASTPGVINGGHSDSSFDAERIRIEGNTLEIKIMPLHQNGISEISNQIVKKVQRRVAKGERRRRVNVKEFELLVQVFNQKS